MELKQARLIAFEICGLLNPYTTKIEIAGSIRRKKETVKDIEIVCRPKLVEQRSEDLFGGKNTLVIDPNFIETVNRLGTIQKGEPTGKYIQIYLREHKITLDLFIPVEEDFFRQLTIRIGPADYSHKVIAGGWRALGWVGSDLGLRMQKDCVRHDLPDGKNKWECVRNKNTKPKAWTSEEDFYLWLGIPYVEPEFRTVEQGNKLLTPL